MNHAKNKVYKLNIDLHLCHITSKYFFNLLCYTCIIMKITQLLYIAKFTIQYFINEKNMIKIFTILYRKNCYATDWAMRSTEFYSTTLSIYY